MPTPNIFYKNLRAEMARNKVTIQDIAEAIGCNRDTASRKLSDRAHIMLYEAMRIKALFPDETYEYLFAELADT